MFDLEVSVNCTCVLCL